MWNGAGQREKELESSRARELERESKRLDNATLAYYGVGAETEDIVDASPVGLGAMLNQKKKDGH